MVAGQFVDGIISVRHRFGSHVTSLNDMTNETATERSPGNELNNLTMRKSRSPDIVDESTYSCRLIPMYESATTRKSKLTQEQ